MSMSASNSHAHFFVLLSLEYTFLQFSVMKRAVVVIIIEVDAMGSTERQHLLGIGREDSEGMKEYQMYVTGENQGWGIFAAKASLFAAPPCTVST